MEGRAAVGRPAEAAGYLRRVIGVDPLRESAQRALMEALAAEGRWAEAVQVYRNLRLLLHRELRADPDPATVAVYRRLREEIRPELPAVRTEDASTGPAILRIPRPISTLVGRDSEIEQVVRCLAGSRLLTLTGPGGGGKTRLAVPVGRAAGG